MQEQQQTPLALVKNELPNIERIIMLNAKPGSDVATLALTELMHLEALSQLKPDILKCTPQSVLLAVKSIINKNLTLDPYAGLVYVKTRSVNIAKYGEKDEWIKVLEMTPSVNGLISINRQLGRLLDFTNPEVKKDASGKVIGVSMQVLLPSYGSARWETRTFDESDFRRWQIASHKENSRSYKANSGKPAPNAQELNYANPNYTNWKGGIDPEFARAKCIRHSLKKLGTNPQEGNAVKVFDVPAVKVVDPEKDEVIDFSAQNDGDIPYVEATEDHEAPNDTNSDIPDTKDL